MKDKAEIYKALDACVHKVERVKLLMAMEESVNGDIALTFELGCILRDLREESVRLKAEL